MPPRSPYDNLVHPRTVKKPVPQIEAERDLVVEDPSSGFVGAVSVSKLASRSRNATVLVRGRPSDQLPTDPRERAAVARILGYGPGETAAMVNDYQRTARRARAVVDRIFWDKD